MTEVGGRRSAKLKSVRELHKSGQLSTFAPAQVKPANDNNLRIQNGGNTMASQPSIELAFEDVLTWYNGSLHSLTFNHFFL